MRKTCINPKLLRLTLEKMVIGVEEPILIKGIGEIIAKVDSGNSGYNVIHGEELIIQGDILTFKTENKDGKERRVSKKIKDTLETIMGKDNVTVQVSTVMDFNQTRATIESYTPNNGSNSGVAVSQQSEKEISTNICYCLRAFLPFCSWHICSNNL